MTSPLTDAQAREIAERYTANPFPIDIALVHAGAAAVPRGEVTDAVIAEEVRKAESSFRHWSDEQAARTVPTVFKVARAIAARVGGGVDPTFKEESKAAWDAVLAVSPNYRRLYDDPSEIGAFIHALHAKVEQAESALAEANKMNYWWECEFCGESKAYANKTEADAALPAERAHYLTCAPALAEAKRAAGRHAGEKALGYLSGSDWLEFKAWLDREYPAPTPASVRCAICKQDGADIGTGQHLTTTECIEALGKAFAQQVAP